LQGGLQTDRLVAEWWIASPRVHAAVERRSTDAVEAAEMEIRVPGAIYAWKADETQRHLAQAVQAENRARFQEAFARGLTVIGFVRDADGNGIYRLGRWMEPDSQ
jgi:predicted GNAT superfamily acetyltransferase